MAPSYALSKMNYLIVPILPLIAACFKSSKMSERKAHIMQMTQSSQNLYLKVHTADDLTQCPETALRTGH